MESILKKREKLKEKIDELGFIDSRYSLFNEPEKKHLEWTMKIDYENNQYVVYGTADRASLTGIKRYFSDFDEASDNFLRRLQSGIEYNLIRTYQGESTNYPSSIWDNLSSEEALKKLRQLGVDI